MEEKWEKQVKMKKDYKQCVFLLETCHDGKEKYGLPEKEEFHRTNFIR